MQSETHPVRLFAIDVLRGLIMVFMALDHANLFIAQQHSSGEYWGGSFPAYHEALPFLTRFVTHFCAPGFFFLMGVGMALFTYSYQQRGWGRWAIIRHFLVRGVLLMALQLLVVNRAWEWSPGGWGIQTYIGVLFALGGTMIIGSLLVWLKLAYLIPVSLVLLVGMELLVPAPAQWGSDFSLAARLLLTPGGIFDPGGKVLVWSNYPVLPWLALATFGLACGRWLADDSAQAYRRAWQIGIALLALFVIVRYLDGFGNIHPRAGDTWIDFLNVVKYPPSIVFTLLTTGVNLIALGLLGQVGERGRRWLLPLVVFGSVPLFFYILHLFLYAALGHLLTPHGTILAVMYPLWLLGLAILFPLCLAFRNFKQRQPAGSLWRFG